MGFFVIMDGRKLPKELDNVGFELRSTAGIYHESGRKEGFEKSGGYNLRYE